MRKTNDGPRWWTVLGQLLGVYTIAGVALSLPVSLVWPHEFPDLRPYLATAFGVAILLTVAVVLRARRLALGAAILIPVLVAAAWHLYEVRWNPALHELATDGSPAAIAMVLHGRQQGWLGAVAPATVTGCLASLIYALFWMSKLERADAQA